MNEDSDMKIAGSHPSASVLQNDKSGNDGNEVTKTQINAAKQLGKRVAAWFIDDAHKSESNCLNDEGNGEMLLQRRLLLSFTATVGFERFVANDALVGVAQKSFLDAVNAADAEVFRTASDTGAFSFYYLAFRRKTDLERRIGQTFAMLCSHDGDPIFQELGEALYCWFSAEIKRAAHELEID